MKIPQQAKEQLAFFPGFPHNVASKGGQEMTSYLFLFGAIAAEVFATTMIKFADGFTKLLPTILCAAGYILCYALFGKAVEKINLAAAYAIWCGIGIIATSFTSFFLFHERISPAGYLGMALIMAGCLLLNLAGTR